MTDERIEIRIMELEDEIRDLLRQLPRPLRFLVYLYMRYIDREDRNELKRLFDLRTGLEVFDD